MGYYDKTPIGDLNKNYLNEEEKKVKKEENEIELYLLIIYGVFLVLIPFIIGICIF